MKETPQFKEIAARYGLAAPPECVARLTQLVVGSELELEKVARIIASDNELRARLLRVANPKADDPSEYVIDTVEAALMRNGVACAVLVAMGTPLAVALVRTFQTMLGLKLEPALRSSVPALKGEHLLARVRFEGRATGEVFLRLDAGSSLRIASCILGIPVEELAPGPEVNDAVGELLNIMTGNFKSNLCDAGLDCRLNTPVVVLTEELETPTVPGGGMERLLYRSGEIVLHVDLSVNPWNAN